jgi:poly(3-hydroxybutyrate) depolymerase
MVVRKGLGPHVAAAAALALAVILAILLISSAAGQGQAASLQAIAGFGPNPGRLDMHVYVPDGQGTNAALVVALHGCTQNASGFGDETGLTTLADAHKFLLLLPQQRPANHDNRCFNWFREEDNRRNQGESASIRTMIRHALDTYPVDAKKIFVLGLSAGGSMTAVLMANYPELFRGGAIIAGTPYGCNSPTFWTWAGWWLAGWFGDDAAAIYACGLFGNAPAERSAEEWGDFVRASPGATPGRWPTVSLWQGAADDVVDPDNQAELVKQWTNVHGIDRPPDAPVVLDNITHTVYRDAGATPRLETYEIKDFGHAIAVDPGTGPGQCGKTADYVKDADICASLKILQFWGVAP